MQRWCAGDRTANGRARVPFRRNGTERKRHRFYASYCTCVMVEALTTSVNCFCVSTSITVGEAMTSTSFQNITVAETMTSIIYKRQNGSNSSTRKVFHSTKQSRGTYYISQLLLCIHTHHNQGREGPHVFTSASH